LAEEAERERGTRQSPERALADLAAQARANGEISDEDAEALENQLVGELLSRHGSKARDLMPAPVPATSADSLADILERVLDKGIVIAGDIRSPARHRGS